MFRKINENLLRKMIPAWENTADQQVRVAYGYLEGWLSIFLNLVLAVIKTICALWINSISLLADAFHTFSDVLTSVAVLLGFKIAGKPQDAEHPFGHGRAEYVASFIVSALLLLVGVEFLKQSVGKLLHPEPVTYKGLVFVVMLFSALIKEWLYDFAQFLGIKIKSQALIADAWHHRSDAFASLLIGIALLATKFGYYAVDAVLGMIVSFLIMYTGLELIKECSSEIIGKAPSAEFVQEVKDLVLKVEGVKNIHDIQVHQYGQKKYVNIHIEVEPELNVRESHHIADFVEGILNKQLKVNSLVHTDPYQDQA
ncbi:MAG: cation diffusion facilitator family transporter [Clostridia bacterium]|nr:cation diffusion facilitator family transporter [Clostridia bacterium]MDD4145778.1 cation diffusion facilitator family transporter [Clostridia bacterium]MDD4665102.1 cation diffusion facilitator family transporter [Clostridia bacterium]